MEDMRKIYYTPNSEDVEEFFFQHMLKKLSEKPNYKVLYLTPTMFLFRRRANRFSFLFKKHYRKMGKSDYNEQVEQWLQISEFNHWTKHLVYEMKKVKPLSRAESHILIKRAIENVMPNRLDWLAASGDLLDLMLELDTTMLSYDELENISNFEDWKTIIAIYGEYQHLTKQTGQISFGQCVLGLLTHDEILNQYDEVIFDGPFLFFRPIHETLMKRFEYQQKNITFIVPYHRDSKGLANPAFEVIKKSYSVYAPYDQWKFIGKQFVSDSTDLEQLRMAMFTDRSIDNLGSFSIHSHSTIEQEIRQVILHSKALMERGEATYKSIIIVTPDAMTLRPLVREIAEQERLEVEVSERSLLGLSAGEFIQLIYKINWDDRRLEASSYLDLSMFRRILDSGWFPQAKQTIENFQAVEDVFFKSIRSLDEWLEQLKILSEIKKMLNGSDLDYHPLHAVQEESLLTWVTILTEIELIQKNLNGEKQESIHDHVLKLLSELDDLGEKFGFASEETGHEIISRIKAFSESTISQNRLPINSQEFSQLIGQLFVEELNATEDEAQVEKIKPEILVTGIENIAFLDYKYVFMIQFTQDRVPAIPQSKWPLHHDLEWRFISATTSLKLNSVSEWEQLIAEREKYYFYLSFYVPKVEMQLSFPRTQSGERVYPSHYLFDIGRAYKINDQQTVSDVQHLMNHLVTCGIGTVHKYGYGQQVQQDFHKDERLIQSSQLIKKQAVLSTYTIEDLAVYRLCPTRFYYSKLAPEKNVYSNRFQLGRYIAAVLTQRVLKTLFLKLSGEVMSEDTERMNRRNYILLQILPEIMNKEVTDLAFMFPVESEVWQNGLFYADRFVKNIIKIVFNENYAKAVANKGAPTLKVSFEVVPKVELHHVSTSKASYLITGVADLHAKFGSRIRALPITHYPHLLGISSYENENDGEEFSNWFYSFRATFFGNPSEKKIQNEIYSIISMMEEDEHPKREGAHCSYCPFQLSCQKNNNTLNELDQQEVAEANADE
ncbi:PD-(D/E)XK nuclease family protein [Paenibacillus roseipurpureus]|uniref:Uncharacterized protein n=1 Tax=Paenibacillus roseopurpureus TaxID=2918901 RepID=A0AA96RLA1_9BACL|nr:hypothetical protein [Paenibacillus sp. MBLB1832]WNR45126.1 hypothetical protein MJB10_02955 [Paenibacillus sp. MBLB1832]